MAGKYFSIDLFVWLNVLLSVLVVLLNKRIYTHYNFPNVSLTFMHFAVTTVCVFTCEKIDVFRRKSIPTADLLPLSLTLCSFVVFTNFSLQTNTVGTYLAFKMATTPLIVVMETLWCCRKFSNDVLLTLIPILLGILLTAFSDVRVSLLGTIFAVLGVFFTCVYLLMVRTKHRTLRVNSLQLLYYQAPLSAMFLAPVLSVIEPLFSHHGLLAAWSYEAMMVVLLSGLVAFGVNFSMFRMAGNFSPLAYNVIGHVKFCLTFLTGLAVFSERLNQAQMFGTALAFGGSVAFTMLVNGSRRCNDVSVTTPFIDIVRQK